MIKKGILFGFLGLLGIALLGFAYLYFRPPNTAPPASIKVESTEARLARGKYLFDRVALCGDCHSERDFTRFAGPVILEKEGAGFVFPPELGFPGTVVSRNITPDKDTGIGNWTDGEVIRAIREGVSRDGHTLFPLMPYQNFRKMSDEDVYSVVVYLKTLKPVKLAQPPTRINFPVSMFIKSAPQPAGSVPPVDQQDPLKYGEYLVTMGGCSDCHTPFEKGQPVEGKHLAGGRLFKTPMGTVVTANITPDPDTGIGKYSEQDFLNKFYQYKKYVDQGSPQVGPESFTLMPWLLLCELEESDLKAIFAYLKTQPAIYNSVEKHPGYDETVKKKNEPL
ncbi:MAG: c-type cytochrome [Terriglobia bacterium]